MVGMALAGMALGVAQGYGVYRQGKKIARTGEEIKRIYGRLKSQEKILRESEKNTKETAKKLKGEQDIQAKMQYEYNKKEVNRALETNLRGVISGYVSAREDLESEIKNVRSQLAFKNDIKNVEESSIKTDSLNKLKAEADLKAEAILQNQRNDMTETQTQAVSQDYQNRLSFNRIQEGINQNYLVAYSNAELQLRRDLSQLNNTIEAGTNKGQQIVQQGRDLKLQGSNMMTQAVLDGGKKIFMGSFGGFEGLSNSIGNLFGKGGGTLKEVPMLFGNKSSTGIKEVPMLYGKELSMLGV